MRKSGIILILFFLISTIGGDNQVSVTISKNLAKIGDPLIIKFIVKSREVVDSMNIKDDKKEYEILKVGQLIFKKFESHQMVEKDLTLTFFKIGDLKVGPFEVELYDKNHDLIETITTNAIPLTIQSSLDGEKDIKDLKDLVYLKSNPFYSLKYVLFLLIVVIVVVLIIFAFRRIKNKEEQKAMVVLSPIQELEKQIKELRSKGLFEKNRKKEFSLALSSIIKKFLAKNYQVNAEDLTTSETMTFLQQAENLELLKNDFKYVFANCDLIKFAKFDPDSNVYQEVLRRIDEVIAVYNQRAKVEELKNQESLP